ncbi:Z1 domain-containing protein [Spiroplasma endosymbiont of Panorpa germanica]|uniref:Z1 domain-containing protein n=1 Tax=Spiroplasma endosymbiont of Panorpa germanica TaxID=3066314 RepID=UPI0030CE34FB
MCYKILEDFTNLYKSFLSLAWTEEESKEEAIQLVVKKHPITREQLLELLDRGYSKTIEIKRKKEYFVDPIKEENLEYFKDYIKNLLNSGEFLYDDIEEIKRTTLEIGKKINVSDEAEEFSIKGLALGDIQSGKTTNFLALANLAFDLGYMRVIILSGLIEDLRLQTMERTKAAVNYPKDGTNNNFDEWVLFNDKGINLPTANGDLKKDVLQNKSNEIKRKSVWVIKKNVNVLKKINSYFEEVKKMSEDGNNKPINYKTLIIDDESDLASLDNKNRNAPEGEVSKTFEEITKLYNLFKRKVYIGYTASPFANLLTDKNRVANGVNLYPDDFITILNPGSNYTGFSKFNEICENSDHAVSILNEEVVKNFDESFKVNPKLINENPIFEKVFINFLLSSSILRLREKSLEVKKNKIKTLMININHKNIAQSEIKIKMDNLVKFYKSNIDSQDLINKIKKNYTEKFEEVCNFGWESVEKEISLVLNQDEIEAVVVNKDNSSISSSKELQIWIGGYKLSRGLTVPCLLVVLFYRNTGFADTIMQMTRWYGYRSDYIDLIRIFSTSKIINYLISVFSNFETLKTDLREMNSLDITPDEFDIKIKSFNPGLIPTSPNKMKGAIEANRTTFSGRNFLSTYFRDENSNKYNLELTKKFIESFKVAENNPWFKIYESVEFSTIEFFLNSLKLPKSQKEKIELTLSKINKITKNAAFYKKWKIVIPTNKGNKNGVFETKEFNINLSSKSIFSHNLQMDDETNLKTFRVKTVLTTASENFELISKSQKEFKSQKAVIREMSDGPVLFIVFSKIISKENPENTFLDVAPIFAYIIPKNTDEEFTRYYDEPYYINTTNNIDDK